VLDAEADFTSLLNEPHLAVAVSGGSDSTALLLLMRDWAKTHGKSLTALTFDHQLRERSGTEAQWVADLCRQIGVPHQVIKWLGEKPVTGLQARARQARYDALTGFCSKLGIKALVTGHTLDDQAETVVMRSKRTQSAKSLAGIWPEMVWKGIRVVRPLLRCRRAELRSYLVERGQNWIDDPSNANMLFERVRVRAALPEADVYALAGLAETARQTVVSETEAAEKWIARHVTFSTTGYFTLDRSGCSKVTFDVLSSALFLLIFRVSGQRPKTVAQQHAVVRWFLQRGVGRRTICGVAIVKQVRSILIGREPGRIATAVLTVPASGELTWDNRFVIRAPAGSVVQAALAVTGRPRVRGVPGFVCDALPAVTTLDGVNLFPVVGETGPVSAHLLVLTGK
jgi:tRNA(Ile)-lysidine synthase